MLPLFPQFKPLLLEDKEAYEKLIAEYPPFSDISFATLQIWWNLEGKLELSTLDTNLVIHYQLPFDAKNSGYCLVGSNNLEHSIQTLFDFLGKHKEPIKLVHVPEFVVKQIKNQAKLQLDEELDYNEYLLDSQGLAKLEGSLYRRNRQDVNHLLHEIENRKKEFQPLNFGTQRAQQELLKTISAWEKTRAKDNDPDRDEHQAIKKTLQHAEKLDIRHLGFYIDDRLFGIVLYHRPQNKEYFIMHHLKVDYSIPHIFDYITHHIATKAVQEGVKFINMEMDLGIEGLRKHKTRLRPVDFFRKYTITPAK